MRTTTTKPNGGDADLVRKGLDVVDGLVELFLRTIIKPFLAYHEVFYNALNKNLRKLLDDNKAKIPEWMTANFITYLRTAFVVPCVLMLAWGYRLVPSLIVIAVDFGDFLDGVVARFWVDMKKEAAAAAGQNKDADDASKDKPAPPSPDASDDGSYEVVTTGSPQNLLSWLTIHRNRTYGGFVDAVCDKAFVVPCWISMLHLVPSGGFYASYFRWLQYAVLVFLSLAEVASGTIRFRAYFSSGGVAAPAVEGFDFSTSAVKADHVGKAKQSFEMLGTAFFILPFFRLLGLALLLLALPLAYESVRRKISGRTIYVNGTMDKFDHKTMKFWMQCKAMGSTLIVGVSKTNTDMVLNACASTSVDEVIAEAPETLDVLFLEKRNIDFVVASKDQPKFVTEEVVKAKKYLSIGDDGVARLVMPKEDSKQD